MVLLLKKKFRMCGLGKKTRPRAKDQGQIYKAKTQAKTSADKAKTQAKASSLKAMTQAKAAKSHPQGQTKDNAKTKAEHHCMAPDIKAKLRKKNNMIRA